MTSVLAEMTVSVLQITLLTGSIRKGQGHLPKDYLKDKDPTSADFGVKHWQWEQDSGLCNSLGHNRYSKCPPVSDIFMPHFLKKEH